MPNEVNECDNSMGFLLTDLEYELTTEHIGAFQSINDELTLLRAKINFLERKEIMLYCLESAGVDNWSGYSYSFEVMKEYYPEEYKRRFGDE